MDQPLANPLLPALIATYLARCAVEGKSPAPSRPIGRR